MSKFLNMQYGILYHNMQMKRKETVMLNQLFVICVHLQGKEVLVTEI
jgi:hypothetical protein